MPDTLIASQLHRESQGVMPIAKVPYIQILLCSKLLYCAGLMYWVVHLCADLTYWVLRIWMNG